MKKLCAILMALIMLLALIPVGAIPVAAATSGTTGDCTWTLDGTHLTISGNGAMGNYSNTYFDGLSCTDAPWGWTITSVTIEEGVTDIGWCAFTGCKSLTSVTIGNNVGSIGPNAFSNCDSLMSVTIPDSVHAIMDCAFSDCDSLISIVVDEDNSCYSSLDGVLFEEDSMTLVQYPGGKSGAYIIPDSVTTIGTWAFADCYYLTSVTIPDSITTIGNSAFQYCKSLTSVTIPNSVTAIGDYAFYNCESLTSVTIGDSVTAIGDSLFYECHSLTSVAIGNSVTTIGDYAFYDCYSLTSVTIPDSVTTIEDYVFYDCYSLTSVTIPNSVTAIGDDAFDNCYSLISIVVDEDNPQYRSLDGVLFSENLMTLVQYPSGKSGTYIIPDSVTTIGPWAFDNCHYLTSVTIPGSVTTIGDGSFANCSALTSVTIGDSVTAIGRSAFYNCYSLTSVTIGNSVTTIGDWAFAYCRSLTSVIIPNSVTIIGSRVFSGCKSLTSVYYHGSQQDEAAISIDYGNTELTSATWHYFDNACDATCNECDQWRTPPHMYANACDGNCDLCGAVREVPAHVYDNACDTICNVCGAVREAGEHVYFDTCDCDCNVCREERVPPHDYGTCDNEQCRTCGAWRDALDHFYDDEYDADCNECGAIREVEMVLPVTFGGNSVSEEVSGLAFQFCVDAIGMTTIDRTTAVYDNATVNGHRLLSMGAVVSNAVESVDIPAVYLFDWSDTNVTYAVRLINIPADQYDTTITAIPYFVLEIDGVPTTIYGDAQTASMNGAMNA